MRMPSPFLPQISTTTTEETTVRRSVSGTVETQTVRNYQRDKPAKPTRMQAVFKAAVFLTGFRLAYRTRGGTRKR
jgi:hypothetical protein